MLIGIDLDNVLADMFRKLVEYHNATSGTTITMEQFTSHDVQKVFGGSEDDIKRMIVGFYKSRYYGEVRPVEGAPEAIDKLRQKHELVVITSRPHAFSEETKKWLDAYFPGKFSGVYFTDHFSKEGSDNKAYFCVELGVNMIVDDSLEFAKECSADGIRVLLLDSPWNQGRLPKDITRVYSWKEIVENIR